MFIIKGILFMYNLVIFEGFVFVVCLDVIIKFDYDGNVV